MPSSEVQLGDDYRYPSESVNSIEYRNYRRQL